jgi:HlyD family secretion protein
MNLRKKIVPALIALAILILLALGFRPSPMLVDAESVTRGPLMVTVEDEGRTRVVDRYVISAPITAQARRVTLEVGDAIRRGETLVTLEAIASPALDQRSLAQARARVAGAETALATARAEAAAAAAAARFAAAEHERLASLAERQLIAQNLVEQAQAEKDRSAALLRSAEFRVNTARHELEVARSALAFAAGSDPAQTGEFPLTSPIDGVVLRRHFESGRVVQPGEPILDVGDPQALEIEVDVLSSDAVKIAPGMRVLFERWGESESLEGRVKRIEPVGFTKVSALGVEEQRVWVIADITAPREHWVRLGDAYRVNARFVLWESNDVLRAPTSALFRHNDGWAVFVVQNGRAHLRPVEIGQRSALHSEVRGELDAGEMVIVHPDRDLNDGGRVTLREERAR